MRWVNPARGQPERKLLTEKLAGLVVRWADSDLQEAFDPRRGEGYYRIDARREKYYDGTIHE